MRSHRNNKGLAVAVVSLILVSLVVVAVAAQAGVPKKINYQMKLTDTDTGDPLPGSHDLTFRIYEYELGGTALWTESHTVSADTSGVISVILGSTNPIGISLDGSRWLEVEVDSETLSPRRELVSVPYALTSDHAANADSLGGTAAASFLTDGHSLDADDGDPVDVVYVDYYGRVGVGTDDPDYALHVYSDQPVPTEIVIQNNNESSEENSWQALAFSDESGYSAGFRAYDLDDGTHHGKLTIHNNRLDGDIGFEVGGYETMLISDNNRVGILEPDPSQTLDVRGNIEARILYLGNETSSGNLQLRDAASSIPVVELRKVGDGGRIDVLSASGAIHTSLESETSLGGGGFLQIRRKPSYAGFTVDGNYNDTQDTRVTIVGDGAATTFDMSKTGNNSVVLPGSSIAANEILDEPGVASTRTHYTSGTALQLENGFNTLASKSITVPAGGYVLALASAQPTITHSYATDSQAEFGVSDIEGLFPENQDCLLMIDGDNPGGVYTFPITVHGLFQVPDDGTYTFYFLGRKYGGAFTGNDVQFTLVYFASDHGTVDPTFAGGGGEDFSTEAEGTVFSKAEEVAREREEEEQAHRERVEQEMAEMRAQIEALKLEIDGGLNTETE
jgi:hypothetical protein